MPHRILLASFVLLAARAAGAVDLVGYVPDYRMGDANYMNNVLPAQLAMLDEVRYFGVTVTANGGLTTTANDLVNINTIKQKINLLPEADRPRLNITLGGFNQSDGFAAVAQNATLRTQLAQNIDSLLDDTGTVGVDLDWEHPAEGAQLTTHYPALLSRIKQELGATRRVYATVSPEKMLPRSVFDGANAVDGVSIMTYDIGWWANDPVDPNLNQHSLHEYVEDTVEAWTNPVGTAIPRTYVFFPKRSIDAPESKLGVGSPFYGRGFNGSNQNTAVAWRDLAALPSADGNTFVYQGQNIWLPGKQALADRVEYAHEQGLQHIIFWEMYHDLPPSHPDSLLRAAYEARNLLAAVPGDFNADGLIDGADFLVWQRQVTAAAPALASSASIPEPAGLILFPLGWAATVLLYRHAAL